MVVLIHFTNGRRRGVEKDCLIVWPTASHTYRRTQLALQMDRLWSPTLTLLGGSKGHWSEARWWSHVFIPGCYEEDIYQWMITVFFPVLCWPCWGENLHHNIFKGTSHHMKQYCMWQLTCNLWKWRGCVHPLWLILIFFVCDRPRTWWEERRHFLGTEQPQRSIFPTCCCSIFNAVHPCCSRREWQWKAWVTFTFVVILLRFVLGKENSHWWRSASLWGKLKFLSVPSNNGRNHFTV